MRYLILFLFPFVLQAQNTFTLKKDIVFDQGGLITTVKANRYDVGYYNLVIDPMSRKIDVDLGIINKATGNPELVLRHYSFTDDGYDNTLLPPTNQEEVSDKAAEKEKLEAQVSSLTTQLNTAQSAYDALVSNWPAEPTEEQQSERTGLSGQINSVSGQLGKAQSDFQACIVPALRYNKWFTYDQAKALFDGDFLLDKQKASILSMVPTPWEEGTTLGEYINF